MPSTKERLDRLLVEKGLADSRHQAQGRIMAGEVRVDGKRITKAGAQVSMKAQIELIGEDLPFVSRGGVKLEAALEAFSIDVSGLACLDVGASTGGFTDCLLQRGAAKVTAIDVGYGQLHWKLRSDPRVTVLERTNVRHLEASGLPYLSDFASIDVSFISLKIVVPSVLRLLKKDKALVCLIKPQFEVGKGLVGKRGVVRDIALHQQVIKDLSTTFRAMDLRVFGIIDSPVLGPKGNKEFLMYLK
jgi:23S rRNA (cytidine1920-2'-O)/16S rRNA (cytidine1409-2'-O)-methyltransferase